MADDLKKILIEEAHLDEAEYEELEREAKEKSKSIETLLISSGAITEENLFKFKAKLGSVEYINLISVEIPKDVLLILPQELAENYKMVVFEKKGKEIKVAFLDPKDFKAREAIEFIARNEELKVKYFLTTPTSLKSALRQYGNLSEEVLEALSQAEKKYAKREEEQAKKGGELKAEELVLKSAPVTKIVSVILRHAVEGGASDIHIEPLPNQSRVRYRIDGVLHTSILLPLYIHASLVTRIKVMANLKIDETRVPQDGRIRIHLVDKDIDFRVSILPLRDQEKVVMRVLDTAKGAPPLSQLGYLGRNLEIIEKNSLKPNGMLLVTGPTGSGKSMTLFAILSRLNTEDVSIYTLEDPVEYQLSGTSQSQIRPEVGYTFASGLRALLRQDPDIIMVGEIRDTETAELAVHAALTGHLVLSTLHTNDAGTAIPRLIDMHIEPFLLGSTLNVIVAQRLVRKICQECKRQISLPDVILKEVQEALLSISPDMYYSGKPQKLTFYAGKGCTHCGNTGYRGRTAICEVIEITSNMKKIIVSGFKSDDVKAELQGQKFIALKQDGLMKALSGVTTVEEVLAATKEEF